MDGKYFIVPLISIIIIFYFIRGISSTVRRCIEKETGKAFAAKIIDLSNDSDGLSAKEATIQEVAILRHVAGHPYISKILN